MSNQNIFTKATLLLGFFSLLLIFPVLTGGLSADEPEGKETEKPVSTEETKAEENRKQAAEAKAILLKSKNMLLELRSLKAKIKETIVIGNRRFRAEGDPCAGSGVGGGCS